MAILPRDYERVMLQIICFVSRWTFTITEVEGRKAPDFFYGSSVKPGEHLGLWEILLSPNSLSTTLLCQRSSHR